MRLHQTGPSKLLFQSQVFIMAFAPAVLTVWYGLERFGARVPREWALCRLSIVFFDLWDVRLVPLLRGHLHTNRAACRLTDLVWYRGKI